jgi:hypothetical protein
VLRCLPYAVLSISGISRGVTEGKADSLFAQLVLRYNRMARFLKCFHQFGTGCDLTEKLFPIRHADTTFFLRMFGVPSTDNSSWLPHVNSLLEYLSVNYAFTIVNLGMALPGHL